NLIDKSKIDKMKKTSIIINTSRGEIINEVDLLSALETSQISGAALDVLANEHISPIKQSHPLIEYAKTHKNLIITPHIGGATYESMHKTEVFMAKKLSEWIKSMNAGLN
ncbi:MAG: cytidylyltransferase, partial [SAR202 cluster bacterium]|nr:cytidylyltransferase [SAR202 cluster bacterium]